MKTARSARYLTQRELADLVGVSSERMGAIEQAEVTGIDHSRIPRFAAALKMTEAQFIKQIGAPEDAPHSKRNRAKGEVPSLPDPAATGMDFVRRSLVAGPLADRVRLLAQLTHEQTRALRAALDARLELPETAALSMADGLDVVFVDPAKLPAPALDVHVLGKGRRRRTK